MTIHVNIGQAKTRLSELVAAAVKGEEVILSKAGEPQVVLTPVKRPDSPEELDRRREKRRSAFGMWRHLVPDPDIEVPPSMKDEELEERWRRKFGASD